MTGSLSNAASRGAAMPSGRAWPGAAMSTGGAWRRGAMSTGGAWRRGAMPSGRAEGASPWRAAGPGADVRVGDRERAAAADRLAAHAAAGRLTVEELEQRVERAHAAVRRRDLDVLLADLPAASAGADARGTAPLAWRRDVAAPGGPAAAALAVAAALAATVALSVVVGHPLPPLFLALLLVWRRFA